MGLELSVSAWKSANVDCGLGKILPNLGAGVLACPLVGSLLVPDLWNPLHLFKDV
jgi:hypothetical protein